MKYFIIFFGSSPGREIPEKIALKVEKIDLRWKALPGRGGIWSFWGGGHRPAGLKKLYNKTNSI